MRRTLSNFDPTGLAIYAVAAVVMLVIVMSVVPTSRTGALIGPEVTACSYDISGAYVCETLDR
jgi:hypothetical protein